MTKLVKNKSSQAHMVWYSVVNDYELTVKILRNTRSVEIYGTSTCRRHVSWSTGGIP